MQSILFFGGNRYFGKLLLNLLSKNKFKIYVVNRGNIKTKNNKKITYIKCDRNNVDELIKKLKKKKFDFIFDNIAYDLKFIKPLLHKLKKKFKHYIFSSTVMCYFDASFNNKVSENEKINKKINFLKQFYRNNEIRYAKKKYEIERFLQKSKYNYTILRIHNVIGYNDFSKKTHNFFKFNLYKKDFLKKKIQFCYNIDLVKIILKIFQKKNYFSKNIYNIANDEIDFFTILKFNKNRLNNKEKIKFPMPVGSLMNNSKVKKDLDFKFTNSKKVIFKLKNLTKF
jgi:nucleoside-diphosphate-sugar epimerase